jgi:hypothetical protein
MLLLLHSSVFLLTCFTIHDALQRRDIATGKKRQEDVQRRLTLAQSWWDSISPQQRLQLLTVPLQELQQRAAHLHHLLPHNCPGAGSLSSNRDAVDRGSRHLIAFTVQQLSWHVHIAARCRGSPIKRQHCML